MSSKSDNNNSSTGPDLSLIKFASVGDLNSVKLLVRNGSPVDIVDENGDTPLLVSVVAGHVSVTEYLLRHGANVNHINRFGFSPLLWACEYRSLSVTRLLLDYGASLLHTELEGYSPILIAAKVGSLEILKLLLERGASINDRNRRGDTALLLASAKNRLEVVQYLLQLGSVDVNAVNVEGATPLLMAAFAGNLAICKALVQAGANVNYLSENRGDSPLLLATFKKHSDIVEYLASVGASPSTVNKSGKSVHSFADERMLNALERGVKIFQSTIHSSNHPTNTEGEVREDLRKDKDVGRARERKDDEKYTSEDDPVRKGDSSSEKMYGESVNKETLYGESVNKETLYGENVNREIQDKLRKLRLSGDRRSDIDVSADKDIPLVIVPPSTSNSNTNSNLSPSPSVSVTASTPTDPIMSFMEEEFAKIVGMTAVKDQLRAFYKKMRLDTIRERQLKVKRPSDGRLYHMIFMGPPGTGKTTMAQLVASVMQRVGLLKTNNVITVGNALDLVAGYVGQTPGKVDAKVKEAEGGVLFIDEAYSIVKGREGSEGFGKEAIETIMKHMDPPKCVFILAGYEEQMNQFLDVNEGLTRRIPYRYHFHPYSVEQLGDILISMAKHMDEDLEDGVIPACIDMMNTHLTKKQLESQNAGLVKNWMAFAQYARDDRLDLDEARKNPNLASLLTIKDFEVALIELQKMAAK